MLEAPPLAPVTTERDRVLGRINLLGTAMALFAAAFALGPKSALANIAVLSVIYIRHMLHARDVLLAHMLAFGFAAGFVELAADWWLVHSLDVLTYVPGVPSLAASPIYMPSSWAGMLITFALFGLAIADRRGLVVGTAVSVVAMGVYVPGYELLAAHADWWHYHGAPGLGPVPWLIVVGEVLMAVPLVVMAAVVRRRGLGAAVLLGALQGLWIWGAYFLAHQLTADWPSFF